VCACNSDMKSASIWFFDLPSTSIHHTSVFALFQRHQR